MAGSSSRRGSTESSNPATFPSGVPPLYGSSDHSFTLQAIMEMQRSLGELKASSTQAAEQLKEHSELVRGIRDRLAWFSGAAAVVAVVLVALLGIATWAIDKAVDRALEGYKIVPVSDASSSAGTGAKPPAP